MKKITSVLSLVAFINLFGVSSAFAGLVATAPSLYDHKVYSGANCIGEGWPATYYMRVNGRAQITNSASTEQRVQCAITRDSVKSNNGFTVVASIYNPGGGQFLCYSKSHSNGGTGWKQSDGESTTYSGWRNFYMYVPATSASYGKFSFECFVPAGGKISQYRVIEYNNNDN